MREVEKKGAGSVPLHLRHNASNTDLKCKSYSYPHSYPKHFVDQNYFPDSFKERPIFYRPQNQGREISIKARLFELWKDRYK